MIWLTNEIKFPDISEADKNGLLAIGGDLSPERLLLSYRSGIFPWYNSGEIIQWWSPDPRFVLFPSDLKISKSTRKILNKKLFHFTEDQCFREVILQCSAIQRPGQEGTWITHEMIDAYCALHEKKLAKSVEVWKDGELVGGFYGIDLKSIFCGESMFSKVSNASKCGFTYFVKKYSYKYKLIDCQIYSSYLEQLGAVGISREKFKEFLTQNVP
ncbi:MAG: leucyl/phenylalanyl-tRNA--protein transferase [Flavobacteriaceae bacterium]|jgi:leucyl/phenylalanyl-tRNA--protein transferase|nr:leucyl/phenylalanyl-tRNA--protein transferase [Flavobacteriaceae bacterium]